MRHLHRDYSTSHCGLDISTLLATHDEADTDCPDCITGLAEFRAAEAAARAAVEAELAARAEREAASLKAKSQ